VKDKEERNVQGFGTIVFDENIIWSDKSFFNGTFFQGQPCGMGKLIYKSGNKSEGIFTNDKSCNLNSDQNDETERHIWTFENDLHFYHTSKKDLEPIL